jgi:hypothetical protein
VITSGYWKFLSEHGAGLLTGHDWTARRDTWVEANGVRACRSGIHACRLRDLPFWLGPQLWTIELEDVLDLDDKVVARRGRLGQRVEAWDATCQAELAVACLGRAVGHAGDELARAGADSDADRLRSHGDLSDADARSALAQVAAEVAAACARTGHRPAERLAGYVYDIVTYLDEYPVATVAYIAVRAAAERSDADGEAMERAWQSEWLVRRLGLLP